MINTLRKKMIWICCAAVTAVFFLIFAAIYLGGTGMMNRTMDMMADRISEDNGVFRPFGPENPMPPGMGRFPDFFTEETPFSTRFFTVWITEEGEITGVNLESVSSVTEAEAREAARWAARKCWFPSFLLSGSRKTGRVILLRKQRRVSGR